MRHSTFSSSQSIFAKLGLRNATPSIKDQGIYAKGTTSFVRLESHPSKRVDYAKYSTLPYVERRDETLELVVVNESFDADSVRFFLCCMGLKGQVKRLSPSITQINRTKHRITFDAPVSPNHWLYVQDKTDSDNSLSVIALSHPGGHLIKVFSDMTQPVKTILPQLNKALISYPDNDALRTLLPVWERKDRNLKDNKCFGLCEEQWEYYIYADDRRSKERFLKRAKQFLVGYLRKFPKGLHSIEAHKRLSLIEQKFQDLKQIMY